MDKKGICIVKIETDCEDQFLSNFLVIKFRIVVYYGVDVEVD